MITSTLWDARYIVVDVETTGSDPTRHRIIEIACLVVEDGAVTERFVSLVNPHQPIPRSITELTGITNSMLVSAPEETEVFSRVAHLLTLPDAVFVAHNAAFDWKFLLNTFRRLGYSGTEAVPRLCTYRLARRLLPSTVRRKGLDGLIAYFDIPVSGRHRAEPDAQATVHILRHLLQYAIDRGIDTPLDLLRLQYAPFRRLRETLPKRLLHRLQMLPSNPGVYSFYDRRGRLLYVGKARNLGNRVRSHFSGDTPLCFRLPKHRIWNVLWEETPTELSALLREVELIWQGQPLANTVGRELETYAFVRLTLSEPFPRLCLTTELPDGGNEWLGPLPSHVLAAHLQQLLQRWYRLRPCTGELRNAPAEPACLYAALATCSAPCNGTTPALDYRQQALYLLQDATYNVHRWTQALFETIKQYAERWAFEQAAALRPLWRFLHRWAKSRLPLCLQACSFLLCIPTSLHRWELTCVISGSFRGAYLVSISSDRTGVRRFLTDCLERPRKLSWLDVAHLDVLSRWLAQNPHGGRLLLLPTAPSPEDVTEQLAELLLQPNHLSMGGQPQ
ncbi:MAG: exonuclease domain-containing protein [Candidatus Kapabacteria bacterium]|nr:exonuclease domain-containing protein [Candidatus Kapabacteria bacterium]MDW7996358.1 exonuclease domain-containing protein [Bacteroidota bacterium]